MDKCQAKHHPTPPSALPHLSGLPGAADRITRLGEVLHLSCESSPEKKRDCMERLVTPPRRGTSPTCGSPLPCEQALKRRQLSLHVYPPAPALTHLRGAKFFFANSGSENSSF